MKNVQCCHLAGATAMLLAQAIQEWVCYETGKDELRQQNIFFRVLTAAVIGYDLVCNFFKNRKCKYDSRTDRLKKDQVVLSMIFLS